MDGLVKQMRVRFSGVGQDSTEEPSSIKERTIPVQKTRSFKGEKKKVQNWFQRQFSGQMSGNSESIDIDHATAVAAVAYAINSLEESSTGGPEAPLTKTKSKSKKEDIEISVPGPSSVSRTFTVSGEGTNKSSEGLDRKVTIASAKDDKKPESMLGSGPSVQKVTTPADKKPLNSPSSTKKPESALPKSALPSTIKPVTSTMPKPAQQSTKKPETLALPKPAPLPTLKPPVPPARRPGGEPKADAWEKAEIAKIKERYEKLYATIASWESKKKAKARAKLDKTEKELEKRRARALQHYRNDMDNIDQIAGGARAQAEERRRNEELKAKEKANRIRTTGEMPSSTCLCF